MAVDPEMLQSLPECFLNTLSPLAEPRRSAEAKLAKFSEFPNYGLAVLTLIRSPGVDPKIQQAAAVNFKNHLKARWAPSARRLEPNVPVPNPIPDDEKKLIKDNIVDLMLDSSPSIKAQLSEALVEIGKHDFPRQWLELLPILNSKLEQALIGGGNYSVINGVLGTANALFKKFRHGYGTNDLRLDLRYCLDNFAVPSLKLFSHTAMLIESGVNSGAAAANLKPLFESQRLCCRIFYSFNFQEMPDLFEDNMDPFMNVFGKYLVTVYPALEQGGELDLVDNLRAGICEILTLYVQRTEEAFEKYIGDFERAVRSLLVTVSAAPGRDHLAITAIKFLEKVSEMAHHYKIAADDASIEQICRSIVIPNVMLREEDEELFEMNYIEFIRRDLEGSDIDTRRRAACELLKGIATHNRDKVAAMVNSVIQTMLATFAENPAGNWKYKDSAIHLVISLNTFKATVPNVLTGHFDLQSFFDMVVVTELQAQDVNSYPPLKAGVLKFLTVFRDQLPKHRVVDLIPQVIRFLGSESNVVHSYAAIFIEKLLLVKDEGVRARYTASDIAPFIQALLNNLFNALKFPESEENQYVMKCIMRVFGVAKFSPDDAPRLMSSVADILNEVCKNPKNPVFNHYLFEAVAVLIRAADGNPTVILSFESSLFGSLETILSNNVVEFFPYAFQLLAQLVELNKPPLHATYMNFFQILLSPELWTKSSDVPALVRLLQAYLRMASNELNQGGKLDAVITIWGNLLSAPRTFEQAFFLLNTVVENLRFDVIAKYNQHILVTLLTRLQSSPTPRFIRCLIIFMSLYIVKHGWSNLITTMDSIQPGLFLTILEKFWIPNLKQITGATETKLSAVASTNLICEYPRLLEPDAARLWGKMLNSILTLVTRPEEERVEEETEVPDFVEAGGYTASYVRLYNAGKKEEDPLKEIKNTKQFLLASLARLPGFTSGNFAQIIMENVEHANQAALSQP